MANIFEDSFAVANAPRFVDFNALDQDEDIGNRSAWFDSHESFYADATMLMSSPSKKKTKTKKKKDNTTKKSTVATKTKISTSETVKSAPTTRIRSARARSSALQPVTTLSEEAATQRKRKRAASVRAQLEGNRGAPSAIPIKETMVKGLAAATTSNDKENLVFPNSNNIDMNLIAVKAPLSPVPEAKQLALDRMILEQLEKRRAGRRQASIASAPSPAIDQAPLVDAVGESISSAPTAAASSEIDLQKVGQQYLPADLPVWPAASSTLASTCLQAVKEKTRTKSSRREAGKVPVTVGKVLQQQRTHRLVNEMAKQRERAKSQREQHRARAEREVTKRMQLDQEKEQKTRIKAEQLEQLKKQREQEKRQKLKEKERREAEERQRKMSRFEEKQHRKQLTLGEKQVLAEEFIVRSVKPLTFPKEFRFATEARSRSNKVKHEEQALALVKPTATAATRVRASGSNRRVHSSTRTQGSTKPFVFSTAARAARKRPVPAEEAATTRGAATSSSRKKRRTEPSNEDQPAH